MHHTSTCATTRGSPPPRGRLGIPSAKNLGRQSAIVGGHCNLYTITAIWEQRKSLHCVCHKTVPERLQNLAVVSKGTMMWVSTTTRGVASRWGGQLQHYPVLHLGTVLFPPLPSQRSLWKESSSIKRWPYCMMGLRVKLLFCVVQRIAVLTKATSFLGFFFSTEK